MNPNVIKIHPNQIKLQAKKGVQSIIMTLVVEDDSILCLGKAAVQLFVVSIIVGTSRSPSKYKTNSHKTPLNLN